MRIDLGNPKNTLETVSYTHLDVYKRQVVRKGISIFASYTFAIYLVHHILVGKFVFPLAGRPVGRLENYLVFGKYFLFISVVGLVFYWLSRILTQVVTIFIRVLRNPS